MPFPTIPTGGNNFALPSGTNKVNTNQTHVGETNTTTPTTVTTPVEDHGGHGPTETTEPKYDSHFILDATEEVETDFRGTFLNKTGVQGGYQTHLGKDHQYHFKGYGIANLQTSQDGSGIGLGGGAHLRKLCGPTGQSSQNFWEIGVHSTHTFALTPSGGHGGHGGLSGLHLEAEGAFGRQFNLGHERNISVFGLAGAEYSHQHVTPQLGLGGSYETGRFGFGLDAKVNPLAGANIPETFQVCGTLTFKLSK